MSPRSGNFVCAVTGEVLSPEKAVRFAKGPGDVWVPDVDGDLPGDGLWLTLERKVIAQAVAEGRMGPVATSDALLEQLDRLLVRKGLELLGLARKSGAAVMGFEKVRALLEGKSPALLVQASDAAEDGKRKLRQKVTPGNGFELFDMESLSRAVGKENTVHIGVKAGITTGRLEKELRRLSAVRREREITGA